MDQRERIRIETDIVSFILLLLLFLLFIIDTKSIKKTKIMIYDQLQDVTRRIAMNFTTIYEKKEGGKNYKNMNSNSHFEKAKKQKKEKKKKNKN